MEWRAYLSFKFFSRSLFEMANKPFFILGIFCVPSLKWQVASEWIVFLHVHAFNKGATFL